MVRGPIPSLTTMGMKLGARIAHFGTAPGMRKSSRTMRRLNPTISSAARTAACSSRSAKLEGYDSGHVGVVRDHAAGARKPNDVDADADTHRAVSRGRDG